METYSHSRLSTFETCKLQFKYKYLDKLEPEIKNTIEAFLGSQVHDTFEKLYTDLKFDIINTKEQLLAFLEKKWAENWTDDILIVNQEYTVENYLSMAKKFVSDYYDHYHPFHQAKTIGCEIHVTIKLDSEGKYKVQGYIDRLDEKDGVYEIHDYKTSKSLPIQEYLDKDRQLALYAIAVKENYADAKDVKLVWHYVAFDKEVSSKRTDEQLNSLRHEIISLIDEIEQCTDFPATKSSLCDWCGYKPICPEWKHMYKTEPDDGFALVNEYAALKAKESEIKKRLEDLKNRIVAFAEQEGVDALFGSDKRAKIWKKDCDKFPTTTNPAYEEFVNKTKELGVFDKFSRLDLFGLEKAFENKALSQEILSELEKFSTKTTIEKIYLSKK